MNNQFRVQGSGFRVPIQNANIKNQNDISKIATLPAKVRWRVARNDTGSVIARSPSTAGRRSNLLFLITLILLLVWISPAQAKVVSSTELIEHPKKYDGKIVTFRGEVVGDVMVRGDFAWINVNDDPYRPPKVVKKQKLAGYNRGQSIWIKREEAQKIIHSGTYKHAGDIVEVVGTFNRACSEHGGDMDIHGKELKIVKRGYLVKHPLQWPKGSAALSLLILALVLFQANRIFQKKQT